MPIMPSNNNITHIGNNSNQEAVVTATPKVGDQHRPHLTTLEEQVYPRTIMP